jgi:hypothetical protein
MLSCNTWIKILSNLLIIFLSRHVLSLVFSCHILKLFLVLIISLLLASDLLMSSMLVGQDMKFIIQILCCDLSLGIMNKVRAKQRKWVKKSPKHGKTPRWKGDLYECKEASVKILKCTHNLGIKSFKVFETLDQGL